MGGGNVTRFRFQHLTPRTKKEPDPMETYIAPETDEMNHVEELQRELPHVPRSTIRLVYRAAMKYVHPADDADSLTAEVIRLLE